MNFASFIAGIIVALGVLASSCDSARVQEVVKTYQPVKATKSDLPKTELSEEVLDGTWESLCYRDDQKPEMFRVNRLTIDASEIALNVTYYKDTSCAIGYYQHVFVGDGTIEETPKGDELTIDYASLSVMPLDSLMSAAFNMYDGYCGVKGWGVGTIQYFKDVASCGQNTNEKFMVELYGEKELFLNEMKFVKRK